MGSEVESGFKSAFKEDFKKYTFSEPMRDNLFNFGDCESFPFGSHFSIQLLAISDRLGEFADLYIEKICNSIANPARPRFCKYV